MTERTQIVSKDGLIFYNDEQEKKHLLDGKATVSMNFWGFQPDLFQYLESGFDIFIRQNAMSPKSEYLLPSVVQQLIDAQKAQVKIITANSRWFGVTYKDDKPLVIQKLKELTEQGIYPANLWA